MRRHIIALSAGIARHRELCSIDRSIRRRELLYLHHYTHTHGLTHTVYYDVLLGNPFTPRVYQLFSGYILPQRLFLLLMVPGCA